MPPWQVLGSGPLLPAMSSRRFPALKRKRILLGDGAVYFYFSNTDLVNSPLNLVPLSFQHPGGKPQLPCPNYSSPYSMETRLRVARVRCDLSAHNSKSLEFD